MNFLWFFYYINLVCKRWYSVFHLFQPTGDFNWVFKLIYVTFSFQNFNLIFLGCLYIYWIPLSCIACFPCFICIHFEFILPFVLIIFRFLTIFILFELF
jgi:hypothetical protein